MSIAFPQNNILFLLVQDYRQSYYFSSSLDLSDSQYEVPEAKGKIIARKENSYDDYRDYGYYHIFQPVLVRATNKSDFLVNLPFSGDSNDLENMQSVVPIFFLKYTEDKKDEKNAQATIGFAIDVALTFTGIGNLAKLRHVRHFSLFRKAATSGWSALTSGEVALITKGFKGLYSFSETAMGVASFLHSTLTGNCADYADPNHPMHYKYEECRRVEQWLMAGELALLGGHILGRKFFKRASKDLDGHYPSTMTQSQKDVIDGIADVDNAVTNALSDLSSSHPNVHTKIQSYFNSTDPVVKELAIDFLDDFKDNKKALDAFDADNSLFDIWENIASHSGLRRDLEFVIHCKLYKNTSTALYTHWRYGNAELDFKYLDNGTIARDANNNPIMIWKVTGYHHWDIFSDSDIIIKKNTALPLGFRDVRYSRIVAPGVTRVKTNGSTIFPQNWTEGYIAERAAEARKNSKGWIHASRNGEEVRSCTGNIILEDSDLKKYKVKFRFFEYKSGGTWIEESFFVLGKKIREV